MLQAGIQKPNQNLAPTQFVVMGECIQKHYVLGWEPERNGRCITHVGCWVMGVGLVLGGKIRHKTTNNPCWFLSYTKRCEAYGVNGVVR